VKSRTEGEGNGRSWVAKGPGGRGGRGEWPGYREGRGKWGEKGKWDGIGETLRIGGEEEGHGMWVRKERRVALFSRILACHRKRKVQKVHTGQCIYILYKYI
jgi:hypothetical protein